MLWYFSETLRMTLIPAFVAFRSMWERYCRGVNAIVYMVDAADLVNFFIRCLTSLLLINI